MTIDYSIELQAENIYDKRTKEYFQEVLSGYIQGNYRSALVVLWTVAVSDLIFKLQELSEIYEDSNAKNILDTIKEIQDKNPENPQWERELIELIKKRKYFDTYVITQLKNLQNERHLAAHPVIKKDKLELYQPNKETVRAYIRNILENLLTKPPLLKKEIFSKLLEDLSEKKDLFANKEELEKFLIKKYLNKMPTSIKKYIFKHLWKMVFSLNDEKAKENRIINFQTLSILYSTNKELLLDFLCEECNYFSEKISKNLGNKNILGLIALFLFHFPEIIEKCLQQEVKILIINSIKKDERLYGMAYFIFSTPKEYIDFIKKKIIEENNEDYFNVFINSLKRSEDLIKFAKDNDVINDLIEIYLHLFSRSKSYDEADKRFNNLIKPILEYINKDQLIMLIEIINKNNQIYGRGQAYYEHQLVKEKCNKLCNENFDWSKYPKFINSIKND